MAQFTKARFQARLYAFCWTILETRQPDFDGDKMKEQSWIITIFQSMEYANEQEKEVIQKFPEIIKYKPDEDDQNDSIVGTIEGKQVVYKNVDVQLLLKDVDITSYISALSSGQRINALIQSKKEDIRESLIIGGSLLVFVLLIVSIVMLFHIKNLLVILLPLALITLIWGLACLFEKGRFLGVTLLLLTIISITSAAVIWNHYDTTSVLTVSGTKAKYLYYSVQKERKHTTSWGKEVILKKFNTYIENGTSDTLVIYSVTYSQYMMYGWGSYPIEQTIPPRTFTKLLHDPDYTFQPPPQSISVRKKRYETVKPQTRYVLDYKKNINRTH